MAGHIYHWKHGWIPLDAYARGVKSHKIAPAGISSHRLSKTGVAPRVGLPVRSVPDEKARAAARSVELKQLVPGMPGLAEPTFSPAVGIQSAHHTGGLDLTSAQTDAIINHLDRVSEYPMPLHQQRLLTGKTPVRGTGHHGHREVQAKDRARLLKSAVPGMEGGVFPHVVGHNAKSGQQFSGGVQLLPHAADALLEHLNRHNTGTITPRMERAAAGHPSGFTAYTPPRPRGSRLTTAAPRAIGR